MRILSLIFPAVLGAALASNAGPATAPGDVHQQIAAAEARVAAIGYRLAARNAGWCDRRAPQLGWILGDRRLYPAALWPGARAAYNASDADAPFVAALVPGGPADRAGLNVGDSLDPPGIALSASAAAPHARIDAVEQWVSSRGARIEVRLSVNGKMRSIEPEPGCYGDFRVEATAALNAAADGRLIKIPAGLAALFPRDDELAAVVAHELAHNILSHRDRLDAAGVPPDRRRLSKRDQEQIRMTEVDADALSVWLLAGAGYDPNAALSMWDRLARTLRPWHGNRAAPYCELNHKTHQKGRRR
jgi:beta-barrel assembly-enhancing protease